MASNISKRLDKLERLANELLTRQEGPVYCRDGDKAEGIDEGRLIVLRREYVAAPERPALTLPPSTVGPANLFGADAKKPRLRDFHGPIEFPKAGAA